MNYLCDCQPVLSIEHFVCLNQVLAVGFELEASKRKLLLRQGGVLDQGDLVDIMLLLRRYIDDGLI